MAVPLNTPSHAERALKALEREQKQDADDKITVWTFVWTLFAFKMLTVAIIWYAASGSSEATGLLAATTWYWGLIPIVAVSGAAAYRWRLVRMRRQRDRLQDAEWMDRRDRVPVSISDTDVQILIQPDGRDRRPPG